MRDLLWRRYAEVHMECVIPITKELDERAMNAAISATSGEECDRSQRHR